MKVLILFFMTFAATQAVVYDCIYSSKSWAQVGDLYGCTVSSILAGTSSVLEEIQGTKLPGKSNNDVEGFIISRKVVHQFPVNLANFFPNLRAIQLYTTELEQLSVNDLKLFSKLEYLNLAFNFLTTISSDLFKFTPKIKFLFIHNNKLKTVGRGILDVIPELIEADFQANSCISLNAQTPDEIVVLKEDLEAFCSLPDEIDGSTTTVQTTTMNMCSMRCSLDSDSEKIKFNLGKLSSLSQNLKAEIVKLQDENEKLEIEKRIQSEKIVQLEKKL